VNLGINLPGHSTENADYQKAYHCNPIFDFRKRRFIDWMHLFEFGSKKGQYQEMKGIL
jgi:hypothetical protein